MPLRLAGPSPGRVHARGRRALLVALATDNAGSGLFLPLAVVYITHVCRVPLADVGVVLTLGTLCGLLAPPLAGRWVDRVGPRPVVVASQALQAAGIGLYLVAKGPVPVFVATALVAAGTQVFYSALFALIADVSPPGPKDRPFATVAMLRSAAFGLGALASAALLSTLGVKALREALAADVLTFLVAGVVVSVFVLPGPRVAVTTSSASSATSRTPSRAPALSVLSNRPYLALIAVTTLLGLPEDFFLVGGSAYAIDVLHAPHWVPGISTAILTAASAGLTALAVRLTDRWHRTHVMAAGAWCFVAWAASSMAALWLPAPWRATWLLVTSGLLSIGSLLVATRANALAEAAAPVASRGRHLAAFQYAFTAAGLAASLLVSAYAVEAWLPWTLVLIASAAAGILLPALGRQFPDTAGPPAPAVASSTSSVRRQPGGAR